jgi:hypothetical protein
VRSLRRDSIEATRNRRGERDQRVRQVSTRHDALSLAFELKLGELSFRAIESRLFGCRVQPLADPEENRDRVARVPVGRAAILRDRRELRLAEPR